MKYVEIPEVLLNDYASCLIAKHEQRAELMSLKALYDDAIGGSVELFDDCDHLWERIDTLTNAYNMEHSERLELEKEYEQEIKELNEQLEWAKIREANLEAEADEITDELRKALADNKALKSAFYSYARTNINRLGENRNDKKSEV